MNQENTSESKLTLTQKIQFLKGIIKDLENLACEENNQEAENLSQLLQMMTNMFGEVDQRLTTLEKKQEIK